MKLKCFKILKNKSKREFQEKTYQQMKWNIEVFQKQ